MKDNLGAEMDHQRVLNAITELSEEAQPFQVALNGVFAELSRLLDSKLLNIPF